MKVLAICGSIRAASSNRSLLLGLQKAAPAGTDVVLYNGLSELPYFNPDYDVEPLHHAVRQFRDLIRDADALVISSPGYAHGIPGVLKNALDHLVSGPEMVEKKIGIISGSATEGSYALASLIEVLTTMSTRVIPEAVVSVPGVRTKIGAEGEVSDPSVRELLVKVLNALK